MLDSHYVMKSFYSVSILSAILDFIIEIIHKQWKTALDWKFALSIV